MATTVDTPERLLGKAQWITAREQVVAPAGERPAFEFRTSFDAADELLAADLVITAHGVYEVFLNGRRISDIELAPGLTSYAKTLYVQRYDLLASIQPGQNELRFVVSDGWFRGRCGASRIPDNFGTSTAVVARLRLDSSASSTSVLTDETWECGVGAITAADLMDGQFTDFRRADAVIWEPVALSEDPLVADTGRLTWNPAPPVRRVLEVPARSVKRLASGRQIVDFGTMINGWVRLADLGPSGTTTTLKHGEWLHHNGDLDVDHVAYQRWPTTEVLTSGQLDTVISRGDDSDVFEPRHTTHGFRYVAVDGREDDLEPQSLTAMLVRSDLRATGSFSSSDPYLDKLHEIAVRSWQVNTCDVPTDCPQRERWGYTGDFQIFAHTAAFLDDISTFGDKWLQSLQDDQSPHGLITNVAPMCGIDPIIPSLDGAAGWGDSATFVPWELFRTYGDIDALRRRIDMMTRWVDYVAERARNGRHPSRVARSETPLPHEQYIWDTGWQWGEWAEPNVAYDSASDQGIVATAYFKRSADIVALALDRLGEIGRAEAYRELSRHVADSWQTEFWDADAQMLKTERQADYVRALAFGLLPPATAPRLADRLVDLVEAAGDHLTTGFLATGLLLPTLAEHGRADVAYRLLRQATEPGWAVMLERGATTIWEGWDGVDADGNAHHSLAHYSKGAVITFLHEYIGGLRQHPDSVGWERFLVAPTPDELVNAAHVSFDSPRGPIDVSWTRTDQGVDLLLEVPRGASAEVVLPGSEPRICGAGRHHLTTATSAEGGVR